MNFKSDNVVGVHPAIMQAMLEANSGSENSYGSDRFSERLKAVLSDLFECDLTVFLTATGSAANGLGLAALGRPHGAIYAHEQAHINTDEAGLPEFFTGGAKMIPVPGANAKIDLGYVKAHTARAHGLAPHVCKPTCLSISQATELGTIYQVDELAEVGEFAKSNGLALHVDGARFANSLATLQCTPAEASWKAGVDIMSFGATKNGALAAEAVLIFNQRYVPDFAYLHKRGGQLMSKMRFFASQFLGYLQDDLWLKNARHANLRAQQLAQLFNEQQLVVEYAVEANEVFVRLPSSVASHLFMSGALFHEWGVPGGGLYRLVTSCFTTSTQIDDFAACLRSACNV